ncbi:unnamed protein product [Rotaria sordida]|uniref:Uncharacterized protein n=1 Tax=Rotaria sordida TaxID=392033 RepID=A0A818LCD2_9BILA|nr:unnamed protein product [Rotaria sordida]CAF3569947.1 unnamed protein product [Rotaria sordida]
MANNTIRMMSYANNATITTRLSACSQIMNVTQTIQDLYNLYKNNSSNLVSSVFYNISIINFNCTTPFGKYFEQIIIFTRSVSIRIQVALVSIYFDYITGNKFSINGLNGFFIERERSISLSSISLNYNAKFDSCSSIEAAQDPVCLQNSSTPVCISRFTNPWIFNCSEISVTSTISSLSTMNNDRLLSTPILNSWQISLICSLSGFFLLICFLLLGYFCRRRSRSKHFTLTSVNFFNDIKSMQKNGIPLCQTFQRAATIVQPKQRNNLTVAWIHDGINEKSYINLKPTELYNQQIFIDHTKIHDPVFHSNISKNSLKPIYIPNNHINPLTSKVHSIAIISRPVSETSKNQLKSIVDQLEEDKLDPSDSISFHQSNKTNPKKLSISISGQLANTLSLDESLHDEDAWMSILDVANAELDVLDRLENEQDRIKTIV